MTSVNACSIKCYSNCVRTTLLQERMISFVHCAHATDLYAITSSGQLCEYMHACMGKDWHLDVAIIIIIL